jgi:hypothetical protein
MYNFNDMGGMYKRIVVQSVPGKMQETLAKKKKNLKQSKKERWLSDIVPA